MSDVSWQAQNNLNQLIPTQLTGAINTLSTVLVDINVVLADVETIGKTIAQFLGNPTDLLTSFLSEFVTAINDSLSSALSLGGGGILIHPWNRMTKRYVNTSSDSVFPLNIPAMNGQEAFNEFYNSFNNTEDPYRPQWGSATEVTGIGMLVVAPDPAVFLNIIASLQQIMNFKEFGNIINKYTRDVITWGNDVNKQLGADKASSLAKFDVKGITDLTFKNQTGVQAGQKVTFSDVLFNKNVNLPELHWWGLNIADFTFIGGIVSIIDDLIKGLSSLISTTENAILTFLETLLNKIVAIVNLVTEVVKDVQSFLISLQSSGLYFFEIAPGTGGVQYIVSQLQQSISNPTGDATLLVQNLTTSDFSALFFLGASYGIDMAAWQSLFTNAFDQTSAAAQALTEIESISFSIIPNFDSSIFYFNTPINLSVVSQESSAAVQYYFTYSITDQSGNIISSNLTKVLNGNNLQVNTSVVPLSIPAPSSGASSASYTISIEIFNFISYDSTYTATFSVTNAISSLSSTLSANSLACVTATLPGKISISSSNHPSGSMLESQNVSSGQTVCLGSSIKQGVGNLLFTYTGTDGKSVTTGLTNNIGFTVLNLSAPPIPNTIRFTAFPAKICFSFTGSLKYQAIGDTTWTYVTLPSCMSISALGCYNYYIYTPTTGWSNELQFCIVAQATIGTTIC